VAGVVLVDANPEDEWSERFPETHRAGLRLVARGLGVMAALARARIPQLLARLGAFPAVRRVWQQAGGRGGSES